MALPSDLPGEVAAAAAQHHEKLTELDDVRRRREPTRRVEALTLKLAGLSYEQIGEQLKISTDGAQDLVTRTLAAAENRAVAQERALENARLDRVQVAIWPKVLAGDLKAVDTYLKLSARRAKMNGLDAPLEVNLAISVRQEMESALAELERTVLGNTIMGEVINSHDQTG